LDHPGGEAGSARSLLGERTAHVETVEKMTDRKIVAKMMQHFAH
jgi:hypothetical protein